MSEPATNCAVDLGRPCYDVQCIRHGCKRERILAGDRFRPIFPRTPDEPGDIRRAQWECWWTLQSYAARDTALKRHGFRMTFRTWGWDELPTYIRDEFLLHDTPRSAAAKPSK